MCIRDRDRAVLANLCAGVEYGGQPARLIQSGDRVTALVFHRVASGGQHQTAGGALLPFDFAPVQGAVHTGLEDVQQVAVQHGQDGLGLRVAKPGIVLYHSGAVLGEH